jgi:hypothetical protein
MSKIKRYQRKNDSFLIGLKIIPQDAPQVSLQSSLVPINFPAKITKKPPNAMLPL